MIASGALGQPGSSPLPNAGQSGTAFNAAQMHPAAVAASTPPRQNPMNAMHPAAVR